MEKGWGCRRQFVILLQCHPQKAKCKKMKIKFFNEILTLFSQLYPSLQYFILLMRLSLWYCWMYPSILDLSYFSSDVSSGTNDLIVIWWHSKMEQNVQIFPFYRPCFCCPSAQLTCPQQKAHNMIESVKEVFFKVELFLVMVVISPTSALIEKVTFSPGATFGKQNCPSLS